MSFSDYAGLVSEIEQWVWESSDAIERIPSFIVLAETQMKRVLKTREVDGEITLPVDGDGIAELPADFRGVRSLRLADFPYTALTPVALDGLERRWPEATGPSREYAVESENLRTWPRSTSGLRLFYRRGFEPLSEGNPTNWILEKHPDAYLYGALVHAAGFKEEDAAKWVGLFAQAVSDINAQARDEFIGPGAAMQPSGAVV